MNHQKVRLVAGLYFVATPIGTARDITLRALDVLASVDVIAAEDTRSMRRLLDIHAVPLGDRPLLAYHDHNGDAVRPRLLQFLEQGMSVAYASEAGMPLIADPGFVLSRSASDAGYLVTVAPGPSAVLTALALAGLPTDAFFFAGFLPNSKGARRSGLAAVRDVPGTLVFYESPKRVAAMLEDATQVFGAERKAAVCRELTKKFEEVRRGTLGELATELADVRLKGEIVVVIDRGRSASVSNRDIELDLKRALGEMSVKDAADLVSQAHGLPRRQVYQLALKLGKGTA
ncbi:MAG: 16S rRNA (cytidine(1402)-2'-O)-methyltransferase [Paracoccaceae bacterium]